MTAIAMLWKREGDMRTRKQSVSSSALLGLGFLLGVTVAAEAAPYQQFRAGTCPQDFCFIKFPDVPAGKRLVINNVSCYLRLDYDATLNYIALQSRNANDAVRFSVFLDAGSSRTEDPERVYTPNNFVQSFANGNGYFAVQMGIFGVGGDIHQFDCGISGDLQ
jgi:hypothetical protein